MSGIIDLIMISEQDRWLMGDFILSDLMKSQKLRKVKNAFRYKRKKFWFGKCNLKKNGEKTKMDNDVK